MESLTNNIDWLGHASFRILGSRTIYIDPWKIEGNPVDGDIILITHEHYDHYSPEDIDKVAGNDCKIIAPVSCSEKIKGDNIIYMKSGEKTIVNDITIEATVSYNKTKKFHPKDNGWLGYIVDIDRVRIYHSGDTGLIDEMNQIFCDVALLPVSGTYVMNAEDAVEAARRLGPKVAIPMHWGDIIGGKNDAEIFKSSAPCLVVIKDIVS